jgi:hypothetical protein
MRNARLCRSVGSFLDQEADFPFVRFRPRHELADGVEHHLELRVVFPLINNEARSKRSRLKKDFTTRA